MDVLITGALGHIGSRLTGALLNSTLINRVLLLDNMKTQRFCSLRGIIGHPKVAFEDIDCRALGSSEDSLDLKPGSICIHLAAITDAAGSMANRDEVMSHNLAATKHVAEWCYANRIKLVFASSTSVYGSSGGIVDENSDEVFLNPQSPYAESKINEEKTIRNIFRSRDEYMILRLGTIFGPSSGMRFHTAVNKFIFQYLKGDSVTVWETALDQKRPYLHLLDAVESILHLIQMQTWGVSTVNLVTENLTVRQVLEALQNNNILQRPLNVEYVTHEIMNQLSYEVSNSLSQNLGIVYQGSLVSGVNETIDYLVNG